MGVLRKDDQRVAQKTKHSCLTKDGWKLFLLRTQRPDIAVDAGRQHPVLLLPGLGSSGVHSFDLSADVSLADYLAARGWDVWIAELRGNGQSDKPSLLRGRSRWWTIDDYVAVDVPTILRYICTTCGCRRLHILAHSMGGMIVTRILALNGEAASRLQSVTLIGSTPFLKGSWWQASEALMHASRWIWMVPAGKLLHLYSFVALSPLAVPFMDHLYFNPDNTEPALGRALLSRNFSSISPGVILQFSNAFGPSGLMSADRSEAFADPARLAQVKHPVYVIVGDRDRMCPPWGCRKLFDLLGSPDKVFECVGVKNGDRAHYGHFDILMGKVAEVEVFHKLHAWFVQHDSPTTVFDPTPDTESSAQPNGAGVASTTGGAAAAAPASATAAATREGASSVQSGRAAPPVGAAVMATTQQDEGGGGCGKAHIAAAFIPSRL